MTKAQWIDLFDELQAEGGAFDGLVVAALFQSGDTVVAPWVKPGDDLAAELVEEIVDLLSEEGAEVFH